MHTLLGRNYNAIHVKCGCYAGPSGDQSCLEICRPSRLAVSSKLLAVLPSWVSKKFVILKDSKSLYQLIFRLLWSTANSYHWALA